MEVQVINYDEAIAALLNPEYESSDKVNLANGIADGIIEGYKKEIDKLQADHGHEHKERLDNSIRNGLVHVAMLDAVNLSGDELKAASKTLATVISIVEVLEVLRQKNFAN